MRRVKGEVRRGMWEPAGDEMLMDMGDCCRRIRKSNTWIG